MSAEGKAPLPPNLSDNRRVQIQKGLHIQGPVNKLYESGHVNRSSGLSAI